VCKARVTVLLLNKLRESYAFTKVKTKEESSRERLSHPIALYFFDHLLCCSANIMSDRGNPPVRERGPHLLSVLTSRPPGLVDIHPVLVPHVLPSRSPCAPLTGVLLLSYTLCDLLERHVESLFVLNVLARFGGVVFPEGYELRV
jgi:hypothetical protein